MVSLASRRRAVDALVERGCSRTRSCRVIGLSRTASRSEPTERNPELRERILQLAMAYPRYGFRRIHALLEGVNLKAVHRIWKLEGLRLSRKVRCKLKVAKMPVFEPTAPNQAWCMDFATERLENGRQARILAVLDCFTRECLQLKAAPSYPAFAVESDLEWLFLVNGKPGRLISDNGPEFRALTLPEGVEAAFIQPGKPWQNGRVESFFDKLRDELLRGTLFTSGDELQESLDEFQDHYNHHRPHRSLGLISPKAFRAGLTTQTEAAILTL
ncbi:MAG: IS3 family transposase [Armatimonadota bacterium]|nr:IS3 family transposase [Armatimonadota bacterium]